MHLKVDSVVAAACAVAEAGGQTGATGPAVVRGESPGSPLRCDPGPGEGCYPLHRAVSLAVAGRLPAWAITERGLFGTAGRAITTMLIDFIA